MGEQAADGSVTERKILTYAEMTAAQAEREATAGTETATKHVDGIIMFDKDDPCFTFQVDLHELDAEKHVNWKATTIKRGTKLVKSLRGSISLRATMPSDAIITLMCPQLDSKGVQMLDPQGVALPQVPKTFKVKPSTQYGPDRYINFSLEPA